MHLKPIHQPIRIARIFRLLVVFALVSILTATATPESASASTEPTISGRRIYLPMQSSRWPPVPYAPILRGIDNWDHDNHYTVQWQHTPETDDVTYIVEEATDSTFAAANTYVSATTAWEPATEMLPGVYHYRIKAINSWGESPWSDVHTATVFPLHVGLNVQWDGAGYIRGERIYDVGVHISRNADILTEPDTIRVRTHQWYAPDPFGWDAEVWNVFYSVTRGAFLSSSLPSDPSWKWGSHWILPYHVRLHDGQTFMIDGQPFRVTGPHQGFSTSGKTIHYWKMVNKERFLYGDWGDGNRQYVHAGDITLWYDAGPTRLLFYRNVLRRQYDGNRNTGDTVQYIENLTSATSLPSNAGIAVAAQDSRPAPSTDAPMRSEPATAPAIPHASLLPGPFLSD